MTTRRVFYSFHYKPDNWRVGKVRNIGAIEDNQPASDNDWESITGGGESAIRRWIDEQMYGRSCAVVLIGSKTAGRKWINYEIKKAWNDEKGLLGVHIHNLKDRDQKQTTKGANPFDHITIYGEPLSSIVPVHSPWQTESTDVYAYIKDNLAEWIEEAIQIRKSF